MSLFTRLILLYLCIALACAFWNPSIVFGDSKQAETVLNFFNINNTNTTNLNWSSSGDKSTELFKSGCEGAACAIQSFVDPVLNVLGYINLVFNVVFSPFRIMTAVGMPTTLTLLFTLPLIFMFIISIIMFIRGYP